MKNSQQSLRKGKKLMALCLAVAMSVGLVGGLTPTKSDASMPASSVGQVYDGVDFTGLSTKGNHFYYGEYKHATVLSGGDWGTVTEKEESATPVLWRIMGEEGTDGNITALSEYVLDTSPFGDVSNNWDTSALKTKLTEVKNGFTTAEEKQLQETEIQTIRFPDNERITNGPSKLYVPSIVDAGYRNDITWYGKADTTVTQYIGNGGDSNTGNGATLKNGVQASWWLRSPNVVIDDRALFVYPSGYVSYDYVLGDRGVRPALKLNQESVIFTSEIKSTIAASKGETLASANYVAATAGDAKNYKLTILGNDDSKTLGGLPTNKTISPGNSLNLTGLTPSDTSADGYTVNYKIVGTNGSAREIVKVGTTPATTSTDLTLDTADLAVGSYDTYVWLQKNNATTSHEGYAVHHFPLNVENQPTLTVSSENLDFGNQTINTTSTAKTLTVTGSNLKADITLSVPVGFTITKATGWDNRTGGTLNVVFNPGSTGPDNKTLTISSTGATDQTVSLSGTGVLAPTFTTHPSNQTKTAGDGVTFTVETSGYPAPTLKWQVSTNGGTSWSDMPNETGATLILNEVTLDMNGNQYRCLASNSVEGNVPSNVATLTVQAKLLTGTATINNLKPQISDVLEATLDGGNNTGTLTYVWKVDGTKVGTDSTYTVAKEDLGKTITLEISSTIERGTLTSAATDAVTKKVSPAAPVAPTTSNKTNHSITLASQTGYEYSLDGVTWQQSPTFDNLLPGKEYTFYQRLAETEDCQASLISAELKVWTDTSIDPVNPVNPVTPVNPVPASGTNTSAKTGDNSNLLLWGLGLIGALGVLILVKRRKISYKK